MNKIRSLIILCICSVLFTQCKDYLDTPSPGVVDDNFVTTTPKETFKTLSWAYANYRQNSAIPLYNWNDPIGSDAEMYPEQASTNNINAIMDPTSLLVDVMASPFNNLYTTLARAKKVAEIIKSKPAFQADLAAGNVTDWTQLYGEAQTMWAFCYFTLVKHYGDVPYGYENTTLDTYSLTSRFDIYDHILDTLEAAAPLMYPLGSGGITAERFSQTFAYALAGQVAIYAAGYQTIRTDVNGLYGNIQFTKKGNEQAGAVYARRNDYLDYYKIADENFQKAMDNKGTARLITSDDRSYANNPFQRHFQYMNDLQISPESIFEVGNIQGGQSGQTTTSDYPYNFGRPSNGGGSGAAPNKVFAGVRAIPTFYYGGYANGDKRRDVSITVTGSTGDGNEAMLNFKPGSKLDGGVALNKWDDNRMNPPYTSSQRQSGINYPVLRMADVILMQAEAKAAIGESGSAVALVNQIRERAFGNSNHNLAGATGDALIDSIMEERKLEFFGEGIRRWDMIRSGKFSEEAVKVHTEMTAMINDLKSQGYHKFANGRVISNYIWVKKVELKNPLTFDAPSSDDPALYPGWRGQYDWSKSDVAKAVKDTAHNIAIKGLETYIDPNSAQAKSLEADGYVKTNWGIDIANNQASYALNILSGIKSAQDVPKYFFPIPSETISGSKGQVTNGYGLPQQ